MVTLTPEALCRAGLDALRRELGVVGMTRFLQQVQTGRGDYTAERWQWLSTDESIDELAEEANRIMGAQVEKVKAD